MDMTKITMDEFEKGKQLTRSVIIPFGSVEEHGPHLPLGTDTMHALAIAMRTARQRPVFVAAPVWYGLCRSTSQHPGTLTIKGSTLRSMAIDVISALYQQGLTNQIILSGHAGGTHMAFLVDAAEEAIDKLPMLKCAVISIIDLVNECCAELVDTPGDSHAGEVETSLVQAIDPALVKGSATEEYPDFPRYLISREKRIYWQGGVWGDPGKASPEKGDRILELESKKIIEILNSLEEKEAA